MAATPTPRTVRLALAVFVAACGFVVWPPGPRVGWVPDAVVVLLLAPLALVAVARTDATGRSELWPGWIGWTALLLVAAATATAVSVGNPTAVLPAIYVVAIAATVRCALVAVPPEDRLAIAGDALLAGGLVTACVGLGEWVLHNVVGFDTWHDRYPGDLTYPLLGTTSRAAGASLTATMQAVLLVPPLVVGAARLLRGGSRRWEQVCTAVVAVALLATTSKTILVAAFGVALVLRSTLLRPTLLRPTSRTTPRTTASRLVATVGAAAAAILLVLVTHVTVHDAADEAPDIAWARGIPVELPSARLGDLTVEATSYSLLKAAGFGMATERPLLGWGEDGFHQGLVELRPPGWVPPGDAVYDPHSTYVGALAEGGLVGAAALAAFVVAVATACVRLRRTPVGSPADSVALVVSLACFALEAVSTDVLRFRSLWFLIGVLAAVDPGRAERPSEDLARSSAEGVDRAVGSS